MPQPKSIQEINRSRRQKQFFGRNEQLGAFAENLRLPLDDPRHMFIIDIYGQGGVGKSWLLNEFKRIAAKERALTARLDEDVHTSIEAMESLMEQLEKQGLELKHFKERYKAYLQKRHELEQDPDKPEGFAGLLGNVMVKAVIGGIKTSPFGWTTEFIDQKAAEVQTGKALDYLVRKISDKDEQKLVLHPQEILSQELLKDLSVCNELRTIIWLIDTFEQSGQVLESWLLDVMEGKYGDLPSNILFVIAGRDPLNDNLWSDYRGIMLPVELNPFTPEENREYLQRFYINEEADVQTIWNLTNGLPLLVNMLVMQKEQDGEISGESFDTAVERFLCWIREPERRQVVLDASLPRILNQDVLEQITSLENARALFEWLKTQPFVKHREGNGWYYHDLVREMMLRHQNEKSQNEWRQVHGKLHKYYQQKCDDIQKEANNASRMKEYQTYAMEALYHRFSSDPICEKSYAINTIVEALQVEGDFDLRCALTLQEAEKDCGITDDCWGGILVEGLRAHYEHHTLDKNLQMYDKLLFYDRLRRELRAEIYLWRGNTFHQLGRYEDAIADKTRAIELDLQNSIYYQQRGVSYHAAGHYDEAIADETRAIELEPKNSQYYRSRGISLHVTGRYDEAINDITRIIELEPQNAEYYYLRGVSRHSAERYIEAIQDVIRAIELDPQNALYCQQLGLCHYAVRRYDEAIADITRAIELEPQNVANYLSRGLCYLMANRNQEAIADMSQAIELEPENTGNYYMRGMAFLMARSYEEAIADVSRAIEMEPGNAEYYRVRGVTYCAMGEYKEAINDGTHAIELVPQDADNYWERAESYKAMGQDEKAAADIAIAESLEKK